MAEAKRRNSRPSVGRKSSAERKGTLLMDGTAVKSDATLLDESNKLMRRIRR